MLAGLQPLYERHHGVIFTPRALQAAVACASQYSRNKLPDAAVDVMDEAAALCSALAHVRYLRLLYPPQQGTSTVQPPRVSPCSAQAELVLCVYRGVHCTVPGASALQS